LKVKFRNNKLEKCYLKSANAVKVYGDVVARKYIQRINLIKAANSIEDLEKMPGLRFHSLKGNRAGEYAVSLTGFIRLIFMFEGDELNIVLIEEVSKHYDD
jgi:proteic killer suppression protein